jgi:hypothetical protein
MQRILPILLLLCTFILPAPLQAQEDVLTLDEYAALVREATAAARRSDRVGLEEVAGRLTQVERVQLDIDTTIAVDNGWLRAALGGNDPDFTRVADRLGAISDSLAQPPSAAPADARERLQAILDRPPFADPPENPPPRWLIDFFDWLGRVLDWLFSPLGGAPTAASEIMAWVIGIIGLLVLIGLAIYFLRGVRRGVAQEARATPDDPDANLTARTALGQATSLARDGDYRTAVRYLYLSALLWLDERDQIVYDRALTNREYLEQLRANPALQARLAPVIETFDRVWYGHSQIDAQTFETYRRQIDALREG